MKHIVTRLICSCFLVFVSAVAATMNHAQGLSLQIKDKYFEFKSNNIEQAVVTILSDKKAAILLKLKPQAASLLHSLTESAIGETALWIWNGKIICLNKLNTALDKDLTVFNIDPDEAERFVKNLRGE